MRLTKQDIDKVRNMEGFPIGIDEDIIKLSNAPYYTACPNPFIDVFLKENGKPYDEKTDDYKKEPFAADVSEGKTDPLYMAHSYHTKVPYKAIMNYILHYTEPGDIVLDGFAGSGMTGVAAQMCGNPDIEFKQQVERKMKGVKWGSRKAVLNDLSPAATFIASNYNIPVDAFEFEKEALKIIDKCLNECGWMYETFHVDINGDKVCGIDGYIKGRINYTVWSDVFICPNCGEEIVFWDSAVEKDVGKVNEIFNCQNCGMKLKKKDCERAKTLEFDKNLNENVTIAKQVPVMINYIANGKKFEKKPDEDDLRIINKIENMDSLYWVPTDMLPKGDNTEQPLRSHGFSTVNKFYYKRSLYIFSKIFNIARDKGEIGRTIKFLCTSILVKTGSKLHNIGFKNGNLNLAGAMPNVLYVPSTVAERNIIDLLYSKIKDIKKVYENKKEINNCIISCGSCTNLNVLSNSIDYIFTDPPFGSNINYSELSYIWESWLKVKTNNKSEAIINRTQNKGLLEYQELMTECFKEYYRVLKPNRWITVEFHNSKNAVWNSIQEALNKVGFVIADIRVLDKKQGTFKQMTSVAAVKQDLVISAYKPKESFKLRIIKEAGSEETVWYFIRQHLEKLPVVVNNNNKIEAVREREPYLLFDRMVAYHIMNGIIVPIDAADFYKGLDERFVRRDGMYFLHDQVNEYDNTRIISEFQPIQFSLFVTDEKNAIAWLYKELETPQTYGEIQPKFIQELRTLKHEKMPELSELLEENFIQNEKGEWYIPDPTKSGDVIKLREKRLIKEFEEYLNGKGKLKSFRTEAIRAGFAKLWKEKDYKSIIKVANRLPESVIQEDDKLLMYYDISLSRIE